MFRSMTSTVSALSGCVANGHQTVPTFPPPPLKFRTAGFPQSGFKLEVHGDLRSKVGEFKPSTSIHSSTVDLYAAPVWFLSPVALAGKCLGLSNHHAPVQRPLARQRVMLSRRVIAYYGLIRASLPLRPVYELSGRTLPVSRIRAGTERFPNLLCVSVSAVPPPVPRWTARLLVVVTSPRVLAFATFVLARHPLSPRRRFSRRRVTRLQSSLNATARWSCSTFTDKAFYFRAFTPAITGRECRI